jgi:hypothetical protein
VKEILHVCDELSGNKGFGESSVCETDTIAARDRTLEARDGEDFHGRTVGPDDSGERGASQTWHIDVRDEQRDVLVAELEELGSFSAVSGSFDAISRSPQKAPDHFADRRFILREQDELAIPLQCADWSFTYHVRARVFGRR